jgi:Na+-translocating ferredoxin:NAD+ oxidoreductase subunit G
MSDSLLHHPVLKAGLLLAGFAAVGVGLVAFTHSATAERIEANIRKNLLEQLSVLVPPTSIDNDIVSDTVMVKDPEHLGATETKVYLGRKGDQPVAAIFTSVVPDGYSGPINLLVAVRTDGTLGGVRVISHKETPGLGDKIELAKSEWVLSFDGKSLGNPGIDHWKVKRDGGDWDQFTGATITPRSIVKAVKNTLIYFQQHGSGLFKPTDPAVAQSG